MSLELRTPRDDDAAAAAELESGSPRPATDEEVRRAWTAPGVDVRVALRGSALVGAIIVEPEGDEGAQLWIELQAREPEAAAALLEWGQSRAAELGADQAPLLAGAWSTDAIVTATLEAAGFRLRRYTNLMGMELEAEPPPPPVWPPGIAVRRYEESDARAVYESVVEAFLDTWEPIKASFEQWLHWQPDRELWFLAVSDDGELAGAVLCRREESDATRGWITVLAVRRSWRRRGLGEALLRYALGELRRAGCRRAELGVDAPSRTGAERLYERAGMRVEHRYDLYERSG
ncbi:MAG TPA: GNAT family N-acetyltransferase [Gaiellaceae bacterium]